jgi:gas vesicle protein
VKSWKTNGEFKFPYFLVGIVLGVIGTLLLAPSPGGKTWKYLRARSNKGLDYLTQQAKKLRERTEAVIKKGSKLIGSHRNSVDTTTEAEQQPYREENRETGG